MQSQDLSGQDFRRDDLPSQLDVNMFSDSSRGNLGKLNDLIIYHILIYLSSIFCSICNSDTAEVSEGEEGERVVSADGLGRVFRRDRRRR